MRPGGMRNRLRTVPPDATRRCLDRNCAAQLRRSERFRTHGWLDYRQFGEPVRDRRWNGLRAVTPKPTRRRVDGDNLIHLRRFSRGWIWISRTPGIRLDWQPLWHHSGWRIK